jgi:lysozyme family protein
MQYTATALEIFCAATGIVVKPEKGYVYANHEGPPITIKTYKGNTNYKLKMDKAVQITEIKQDEFWRHLGNIQNNKGETKLVDTEMYDGSVHVGVVNRVNRMIQAMRKGKG